MPRKNNNNEIQMKNKILRHTSGALKHFFKFVSSFSTCAFWGAFLDQILPLCWPSEAEHGRTLEKVKPRTASRRDEEFEQKTRTAPEHTKCGSSIGVSEIAFRGRVSACFPGTGAVSAISGSQSSILSPIAPTAGPLRCSPHARAPPTPRHHTCFTADSRAGPTKTP